MKRGYGQGYRVKRSRWAHFVADGSRGGTREAKKVRFPPSPRDQGLVLIWCHFKTVSDYGAKVGTLIHTFIF